MPEQRDVTAPAYEARYRDPDGQIVTVPLDQIEVVRDGRVHARFRQNGYFASLKFIGDVRPFVPVDMQIPDLGAATDV